MVLDPASGAKGGGMTTRAGRLAAFVSLWASGAAWAVTGPSGVNPDVTNARGVAAWCDSARAAFRELKWEVDPCAEIGWIVAGESVQGRPLVYAEFGDLRVVNTTLVFATVHGDEITPLYLGIQLAHWLREHAGALAGVRVVVAPLVNPDSFFSRPRRRVNARGVDVNRNFPTNDWSARALKAWKGRYRSDPRRYPGEEAGSEPETVFQMELIRRVRPHKILSVHAPLNFFDYDGPSLVTLARFHRDYVRECVKLRQRLKAMSGGFFPGSLGNFAGQEKGIPTLTLELPSADAAKAQAYWKRFSSGIQTMIEFRVPDMAFASRGSSAGPAP